MTAVQELLEGRIDFAGQQLAEQITRVVLITFTVISFIVGFALQSLRTTFGIMGAAGVMVALVVLPPWSMYNQHPVKWLPSDKSKDVGSKKAR